MTEEELKKELLRFVWWYEMNTGNELDIDVLKKWVDDYLKQNTLKDENEKVN